MILIQSFDENNWMIEQNFTGTNIAVKIKHQWFSGRIIACHAIDPGSIPGRCKAGEPKTLPEKRKIKFFRFFYCSTVKKEETTKIFRWVQNLISIPVRCKSEKQKNFARKAQT